MREHLPGDHAHGRAMFALAIAAAFFFGRADPISAAETMNSVPGNFSWTVKAPPTEMHLSSGNEPIGVSIVVGPVTATGVKLIETALLEKSRKSVYAANGLMLCDRPVGACAGDELTLTANQAFQLWLRPRGPSANAGQYSGQITVVSGQKPAGDSFLLTIDVSNPLLQALGALTIFGGVVITWFVSTVARARLNRDQLLYPAALLREQAQALKVRLEVGHHADAPICFGRLKDLCDALSLDALTDARYIGPSFPMPWNSMPPAAEAYPQFLQECSDWIVALRVVVDDGLAEVWKLAAQTPAPPPNEVLSSTKMIDGLAGATASNKSPQIENVRASISAELGPGLITSKR